VTVNETEPDRAKAESLRDVFVTVGAFSLAQVRRQKLRSGSGIKGVTVPLGDDRRAVDPIAR
jgi:hypothetical protein